MSLRESATFDRSPARPAAPIGKVPCATPPYRTWLGRLAVVGTVGASFVIFALQVVQGVLLARILGPEARGEYGTVVFYTQTLTYVGLFGTMFSIARRAAQKADLPELRRASLRVGGLTGLATMGFVGVVSLTALPAEKAYLAPMCIACSLMLPWEHMRLAVLAVDHGSGAFARYNTNQLVGAVVFPAMLALVWLRGNGSATVCALLLILAPIAGLAFRLATEKGSIVFGPVSPRPARLIREGFPYLFSVVAADLFARLDVFLILWLASFAVQGYYAAAVPAANLLIVAPNALALFAFNAGAASGPARSLRQVLAAAAGVAAFQTLAAVAFAALLPALIGLVFGRDFLGAVPLAHALLPAYALNGCALVADGYLRGRGMAGAGVRSRLAGAVVMGIAAFLLYDAWRELSVPLAASAGHAVSALWIFVAVVRDVRSHCGETECRERGLIATT